MWSVEERAEMKTVIVVIVIWFVLHYTVVLLVDILSSWPIDFDDIDYDIDDEDWLTIGGG